MKINLDELSYEELVALNHKIVERLKVLDSVHAFQEMMAFDLGAKVSFESNRGRQMGTIVKLNKKTVGVLTESGQKWNVSPHLLSQVKEVKSDIQVVNINQKRKRKNKRKS